MVWQDIRDKISLPLIVSIMLGIFIFVNPFPHNNTTKEGCFYGAVMITAWLLFKRRMTLHWKSPLSLPLLLFTLWAGLSVIWSLDRGNTIHDFRAFWLEYVVLYFLIVNFFNSRKKFVVLAWVFIASSTIFSIWQIWSFYFKGQGQRFITKLSTGLPAVPVNWIGFFVVFAITLIGIVVFDRSRAIRSRVLASFCFIPLFLLIFSTQSRATFGALIVGLAIVFANRKKVFLFFLIIVAVAVMYSPVKNRFYAMYDSPPDIRLAMTLTAIEVVKDYPITGIGYGHGIYYSKIDVDGYSNRLPERYRPKTALYKEPHNGPINIAVKTGIVGLALYLGIIVIFLKICIHLVREGKSWFVKNYARAVLGGFVSFLFTGLFEPAYAYVPTGVFFLILSMGTILDRLNREENEAIK